MYTSHTVLTSIPARTNDHVLRTITSCGRGAAQALASEEFHQEAIAYAARMRLAREAGIEPAGIGSLLGTVRRLIGQALVSSGERLGGRSAAYPATSPTTGA